jgi:calcium-dependent protein kinase
MRKTKERRAVKIMTKSNLSLEHLKEFKNEINLLSEVQHPNVIKVYGSYEDAKRYYIVTDLYQGGELFDLVADPGC